MCSKFSNGLVFTFVRRECSQNPKNCYYCVKLSQTNWIKKNYHKVIKVGLREGKRSLIHFFSIKFEFLFLEYIVQLLIFPQKNNVFYPCFFLFQFSNKYFYFNFPINMIVRKFIFKFKHFILFFLSCNILFFLIYMLLYSFVHFILDFSLT